jgi:pyruvate dehydrogenase E2 component (dihydrolipoamide acetyltransferase)
MAIEFKLPDLGENIESGDVVSVLISEGDEVAVDQSVLELETDKAAVEIPCPYAGQVTKIHVKQGDTVPVGAVLLTIEESAQEDSQPEPSDAGDTSAEAHEEDAAESDESDTPASAEADESEASQEPEVSQEPAREQQPSAAEKPSSAKTSDKAPTAAAPASSKPRPDTKPAKQAPAAEHPVAEKSPRPKSPPRSGGRTSPAREEESDFPIAAGPATRRLARELGFDLRQVAGTGAAGRITRDDVVSAVRQGYQSTEAPASSEAPSEDGPVETSETVAAAESGQDQYGPVTRERLSRIRKTIATNMSHSASTIPHVTNFDDADVTELNKIRKESAADYVGANIKLTMMPFIMKAVAHALRKHPVLNASLDLENGEALYKQYVNLGIAVDTDRGLVVPVVRGADHLSIPDIAHRLADFAEAARTNKLSLEDMRGGTFTISNLGAVGGQYSTPIINSPEVAILLVGRSRKMPVVLDDAIQIRYMMPLSISYDHRLVDGAAAARFLNDVISYLQAPGRLLLAP